MPLVLFCWLHNNSRHSSTWQALGMPLTIRRTTSFATNCKSHVYRWINGDTHCKVMSDIIVKQGCPLSHPLFNLYIDGLEKYLDEIEGCSPCLFDPMVDILLYIDNVVMLSKSRACLQRLLNKLHEFCTSSSLEVNSTKTTTHDLWLQQKEFKLRGILCIHGPNRNDQCT